MRKRSQHKKLSPSDMIRAAGAAIPIEESGIRMALSAICKALECTDHPEWETAHIYSAMDALEVAAYTTRYRACRNYDEVNGFDENEEYNDDEE